jgi:hypothetical protein
MAHTRSAVRQIELYSLSLELLEVFNLGGAVLASATLTKPTSKVMMATFSSLRACQQAALSLRCCFAC